MKPRLKILQDFIKPYFKKNCPIVKYKRMKEVCGLAVMGGNTIYLNPDADHSDLGCDVGPSLFYKPHSKMKIKGNEGYFFTLLHEVAHFKIPFFKKSKKFEKIREKVEKDLGGNPSIEDIVYSAEDYFEDKNWEYQEFMAWISGHSISQHANVDEWAIKEFKKRRKDISKILRSEESFKKLF